MNTFTEKRVIVLFSTAAGLRTYSFTKKGLHIGGILVKFVKFYWISFLQETARRLLLISSNISDTSPALLAVNQLSLSWLSRTSRKSHSWKVSKYGDFSGPYFLVFGLNTEIYSVFSTNTGKYGPEKTPYLDTFHAVSCPLAIQWLIRKYLKWLRSKERFFCGWGRRNKQKKVFSRSNYPGVFCKESILKYLAKLTGKHLCRSLSLACWHEPF